MKKYYKNTSRDFKWLHKMQWDEEEEYWNDGSQTWIISTWWWMLLFPLLYLLNQSSTVTVPYRFFKWGDRNGYGALKELLTNDLRANQNLQQSGFILHFNHRGGDEAITGRFPNAFNLILRKIKSRRLVPNENWSWFNCCYNWWSQPKRESSK